MLVFVICLVKVDNILASRSGCQKFLTWSVDSKDYNAEYCVSFFVILMILMYVCDACVCTLCSKKSDAHIQVIVTTTCQN